MGTPLRDGDPPELVRHIEAVLANAGPLSDEELTELARLFYGPHPAQLHDEGDVA